MRILWLTWKDRRHPLAGGAEVVNEELARRLVLDGHTVIFLVSGFEGGAEKEIIDGYTIIRVGNRWMVYWKAYQYYRRHLQGWADILIDEVNTIPFFAKFYLTTRSASYVFVHQLCREIWFYQMFFPLSLVGYLLEPIYLWLLSDQEIITISESTKRDLMKYGFKRENIHIISEGIELEPLRDIVTQEKFSQPTLLSLGAIRPMKRTNHIIQAYEIAKRQIPELRLVIAGDSSGAYAERMLTALKRKQIHTVYDVHTDANSGDLKNIMDLINSHDVLVVGKIPQGQKLEVMRRSHVIAVTSVKEGWGLIVTEANSQGTPAVVYNVDGLRDSVKNGQTGIVCDRHTPEALANELVKLLKDPQRYNAMRQAAWEWSKTLTFDTSYRDFKRFLRV